MSSLKYKAIMIAHGYIDSFMNQYQLEYDTVKIIIDEYAGNKWTPANINHALDSLKRLHGADTKVKYSKRKLSIDIILKP